MLKKTITYTDYEGEQRTEDFYFNLNKAELMEMELGTTGGMERKLNRIINARDSKEIVSIFKDIILRSYGEKSLDGRKFIKNDDIRNGFAQTEAYSQLFVELASDADAAAAFINGVIPRDMAEELAKQQAGEKALPPVIK